MPGVTISEAQAQALVDHALRCNYDSDGEALAGETRFSDVIADLAAGRPVDDRGLLVRFLWQRVSLAVEMQDPTEDLQAWHAAVGVLEELREDLSDIYTGGPTEWQLEMDRRVNAAIADLKGQPELTAAEIADRWGFSVAFVESLAYVTRDDIEEE